MGGGREREWNMKSRAENIQQKPSGETEASAGFQVELSWQSFGLRHFPINSHLSLPAVVKTLCPLPGCFAILSPACHGVGGRGGTIYSRQEPWRTLDIHVLGFEVCVCHGGGESNLFLGELKQPTTVCQYNIRYRPGRTP